MAGAKSTEFLAIHRNRSLRKLGCALIFLVLSVTSASHAQSSDRKLLLRVPPKYPEYLRTHEIGGVVRLLVEVTPKGNVKAVSALGGNPILVDAATDAVKQWKYVPADKSDSLEVKIDFVPR